MRAFIIGNGPSLERTPLDLLAGEISFATNSIRLIYDKTIWRPTDFIIAIDDYDFAIKELYNEWWHNVVAHMELGIKMHIYSGHISIIAPLLWRNKGPKVHSVDVCRHKFLNFDDPEAPTEWHLPELCGFGSSLNVAMQIASQKYNPLYLVGCDLGYKDNEVNHFDKNYMGKRSPYRKRSAYYCNGNSLRAHECAAQSSPVPIYNATIGGELEVYPRVDLKEILNG